MKLAAVIALLLFQAAAALAEEPPAPAPLKCDKPKSTKDVKNHNPFLQFDLAVAPTQVCIGPDDQSMFWDTPDSRVTITYRNVEGNWRNERWHLKTDPRGAAALNVKAWKMLACAEYSSPQPPGEGGPRAKSVWELHVQRSAGQGPDAIDVSAGWVAGPLATPAKRDLQTFRCDVTGGKCGKAAP